MCKLSFCYSKMPNGYSYFILMFFGVKMIINNQEVNENEGATGFLGDIANSVMFFGIGKQEGGYLDNWSCKYNMF